MAANAALTTAPAPVPLSARQVEYNPFAEDEFAPSSLAGPSTKSKLVPGGGKLGGSNVSNKSSSSGTARSTGGKARSKREESPPLNLGRKEKAARAMAQQLKKSGKNDSLFSVRHLVDRDEKGGSVSPAPRAPYQPNLPQKPVAPSAAARKMIAPGKKGAGAANEMRKLAPGRDGWDRRSIDEIARDLKAKRPQVEGMGRTNSADEVRPVSKVVGVKRPRSTSPAKASAKPKARPPPIPSSARPPPVSSSARPSSSAVQTKRPRPRSPSTSSSSASPPRRGLPDLDPDDVAGVSATIQALFRRPGAKPPKYADSDASSDMEAGMSDVEEEERRAARIARREDELAEKEEREHRERKERMKRERR